jgi:photosystem II stability/assembly factor-like uncharacterized protein
VVDDQTLWVSGTQGKVGLSTDGGKTWTWQHVKGFEKTDFRDIEAFDARTAVIMGIDSPGVVLKTFNAGASWKLVHTDHSSGIFMDAMEFWEDGNGMIVGDPIKGQLYILRTADFGNSWSRYTQHKITTTVEGEAMFASSGTNIRIFSRNEGIVVTGGRSSRVLIHEKWHPLPLLQGATSTGANSIAVSDIRRPRKHLIVVGGDFLRDTLRTGNCALSRDGIHWSTPDIPPFGYRSCVEFIRNKTFIACGTSGVDITTDAGKIWQNISKDSYHVVRKAKKGSAIFLAGSRGRVAKLAL